MFHIHLNRLDLLMTAMCYFYKALPYISFTKNQNKMHSCRYCSQNLVHPKFVYLARDRRIPESKLANAYCYLGLSRHPFHRLMFNQNRKKGWKVGSKATKPIAPHWKLEMILGPFYNGQGEAFKQLWRRGARRFKRRVRFGVEHAQARGATIYCRETQLIQSILS
jgi:hypothetical protein